MKVLTTFTFGTSCAVWFATAGLGGGVVLYSASRSIEEGDTMTSKQNAAQERYDEIPEATPTPAGTMTGANPRVWNCSQSWRRLCEGSRGNGK